mgnify:CR=1 FL=1
MSDIPSAVLPGNAADASVASLKLPPHSLEAEQSVLGGLMLEETAWDRAAEIVSESDFYRRDHRLIFRAIAILAEENKPRDALTVSETLNRLGELEEAGGIAYLGEIVKNTASAANIGAYSEIVRERSVLRQLIKAEKLEKIAGLKKGDAAAASARNRSSSASEANRPRRIIITATSRPRLSCRAR